MTNIGEIYHCEVCGNTVEVISTGVGTLVCCEQPMKRRDAVADDEPAEASMPSMSTESPTLGQ